MTIILPNKGMAMSRIIHFLCISLAVFFATTSLVYAKDNIGAVKSSLAAKHDKVIYGKHINHVEYLKLLASLAGGPAGVADYLTVLATDILTETGSSVGTSTIYDMIRGKQEDTVIGGKPVYVGIATYNHWSDEDWFGVKWKKPEPNTHQLYIAIGKKRPTSDETAAFYVVQNKVLHRVDPGSGDYKKLKHNWDGATSMTGLDGWLYIIQNDVLHRVDPKTGNYAKLKHKWDGPTQMTAMSGSLYVTQNKVLHQVDPTTGDYRKLKHNWDGATSMTANNGNLYVIQNDVLHQVDPFTGDYKKLNHKWDGPTRMTAMNGRLYIVQNKVLHDVDPTTGDYRKLKHNWDGATSMAGFGGKLYIIQNDVLHLVNPLTGDYEKLGHTWDGPTQAAALSVR